MFTLPAADPIDIAAIIVPIFFHFGAKATGRWG